MEQGLFYISFEKNDFYTLVGGVKIFNVQMTKTPVETEDYNQDYAFVIEGSGVLQIKIAGNLLLDPELPKDQWTKLYNSLTSGSLLSLRVTKQNGHKIEGEFVCISINSSHENQQVETFDIEFMSHGKPTISVI